MITGCVDPIVMDPGEEDMPVVVNCILTIQTHDNEKYSVCNNPTLTLQYAKGKSQGDYIPIEDATVILEGEFHNSIDRKKPIPFVHKDGCNWEIAQDVYLGYSSKYRLKVEIPGHETITAETMTPSYAYYLVRYASQPNGIVSPFLFNTSNTKDLSLWVSAGMWSDSYEPLDYIVTDHPYVDDFNVSDRTFSALTFKGEVKDQTGELFKDLFERAKDQFGNLPLHADFLRIGNLEYDGAVSFFAGPLSQPSDSVFPQSLSGYSSLEFLFATEDLDRYLRSVFVRELSLESELPAVYSTSNDIYTNVNGGVGIFGICYKERAAYIR